MGMWDMGQVLVYIEASPRGQARYSFKMSSYGHRKLLPGHQSVAYHIATREINDATKGKWEATWPKDSLAIRPTLRRQEASLGQTTKKSGDDKTRNIESDICEEA